MTKNELGAAIAAILTTALEVGEGEYFPESTAYLALGGDIHKWETVRSVLVGGKLVTLKSNTISLTPLGRDMAQKINAVFSTH